MAITARTTTNATIYFGPDTTKYPSITSLNSANITILWKEGSFYYAETSSPKRRFYIQTSKVTNITGGTPPSPSIVTSIRYTATSGVTRLGPDSSYVETGRLTHPEGMYFLVGNKSATHAMVEYRVSGTAQWKRAWFEHSRMVEALPTSNLPNTLVTPGTWNNRYPLSDLPVNGVWKLSYGGGRQCLGFARMVLDATYGAGTNIPSSALFTDDDAGRDALKALFNSIYVGDRVTFQFRDGTEADEQHAVIVAEKSTSGITVYDCNAKNTNKIDKRPLTWAELTAKYDKIRGGVHRD
ncbi:hypothetical protein SDC9_75223 [bioreactor metagenome]|uniref:Uncharacterized protein n=1 Tax=bioreactor metagenome TaxID=1076179 RepID=A0A644YJN9_9ZZZZ